MKYWKLINLVQNKYNQLINPVQKQHWPYLKTVGVFNTLRLCLVDVEGKQITHMLWLVMDKCTVCE